MPKILQGVFLGAFTQLPPVLTSGRTVVQYQNQENWPWYKSTELFRSHESFMYNFMCVILCDSMCVASMITIIRNCDITGRLPRATALKLHNPHPSLTSKQLKYSLTVFKRTENVYFKKNLSQIDYWYILELLKIGYTLFLALYTHFLLFLQAEL